MSIIGKTRFQQQNTYSASVTYTVDDIVEYNGASYICTANTTAGILPTNASYFTQYNQRFNYRGTYDNTNGTVYLVNDVVSYTTTVTDQLSAFGTQRTITAMYVCIQSCTADGANTYIPLNTTYWTLINSSGNIGARIGTGATSALSLGADGYDESYIVQLANKGIIGDQNVYYQKGYPCQTTGYSNRYINAVGNVIYHGTSTASSGGWNNGDYAADSKVIITFPFYDWYRSTSNGGSGVHSTPDNEPPRCIQIEQGWSYGLALMNSGEVFHWGYGGNGENGDASTSNRGQPTRVGGTYSNIFLAANTTNHKFLNTRIKRISVGRDTNNTSAHHCLALDESGNVWAWGYNGYGQLGNGNTTAQSTPVMIPAASFSNRQIVAIYACGTDYGYSFAIDSTGQLWGWGYNGYGQLGNGNTTNQSSPVQITTQTWTEAGVGTIVKLDYAALSSYGSTVILTSKGRLYVAGVNAAGQLMMTNQTNVTTGFTQAAAGPGSSSSNNASNFWLYGGSYYGSILVKDTSNAMWVCGLNASYQLGTNNTTTYTSPTAALANLWGTAGNLPPINDLTYFGCLGANQYVGVVAVDTSGRCWTAGRQDRGWASNGNAVAYNSSVTDSSGIERDGSNRWQPIQVPPTHVGTIIQVMQFGYENNTNIYPNCAFLNNSGRVMNCGYGGAAQNGHINRNDFYTMQGIPL